MATGRGFPAIMGIGAETTWGTVVAATAKLPFISETLVDGFNHIQNVALLGQAARARPLQGARESGGAVVGYWNYDLAQPLLTHFFGQHTVAVGDDHYDMQDTIDDKGLTLAIDKQVSVHEFAGFKVSELQISGTPTDGVRWQATGVAKSRSLTSVTNTSVTLAALSEPGTPMVFHELVLRVGDLADALASGDNVEHLGGFTLTINRNLESAPINSQQLEEALENNFRDATLVLNVTRYDTDQWINWQTNHTTLQATLTFTRSSAYKIIQLPQLLVTSCPTNVGGPGMIPATINLSLHPNRDNSNTFITADPEIYILEA
jgi:hypothetical protein